MSVKNINRAELWDVALGFAQAIVAAMIWFAIQAGVTSWFAGAASSQPMPDRLWQISILSLLSAVFFAFFALWLGFVPFVMSVAVARYFGFRSMGYYVLCGIVAAIAISPLTAWILPYDDMRDFPPSYWDRCVSWAMASVVPAIVAAVTFWFLYVRSMTQKRFS